MTQEYGNYVVDVCENWDQPMMFDVYIYEGREDDVNGMELVDCDFARSDDPFSLMEEAFGIIDRYMN